MPVESLFVMPHSQLMLVQGRWNPDCRITGSWLLKEKVPVKKESILPVSL